MKMPRGLVLSSLDAHVAQHGVEIERGHVECLRHLRRRQRVLSILVEQGQRRELLWQLVAACLGPSPVEVSMKESGSRDQIR